MRIWDTIEGTWKEKDEVSWTKKQVDAIKLERIVEIEARFFSWRLHEQQEQDFAWLVATLKEELHGS